MREAQCILDTLLNLIFKWYFVYFGWPALIFKWFTDLCQHCHSKAQQRQWKIICFTISVLQSLSNCCSSSEEKQETKRAKIDQFCFNQQFFRQAIACNFTVLYLYLDFLTRCTLVGVGVEKLFHHPVVDYQICAKLPILIWSQNFVPWNSCQLKLLRSSQS